MKINRVILKNIRCLNKLEIMLEGKSALIIGDNGCGKSTVIRSLAMGLCDDSSAAALFRELHGDTVRNRANSGRIEVDLRDRTHDFRTVTEIKALKKFERVEQKVFQRSLRSTKYTEISQSTFPWDRIFATGYGAGIRVQGTSDYDYYLTVDAVYPLFRYDAPLQNPELVVRRLVDAATRNGRSTEAAHTVLTDIRTLLKNVLQLDDQDKVELTRTGITVRGPWGRSQLSSLGDGYRSTVTWVLDLVSWWFLRSADVRRSSGPTTIRGIVLIDEIEQHLHPKWQRNIMRLLTESFPHVQFIATTHSPLVASGCEGIAVHRLADGEDQVEHPFGWLAEDVYRIMGLEQGSRPGRFRRDVLDRVRELDFKRIRGKATAADLAELRKLDQRLGGLPGADPVRTTIGMESIRRLLETPESDKHHKTNAKRQSPG